MGTKGHDMDDALKATLTELWASLTDEQKAKAEACTTMEELLAFAGEEKIELPDDLMDEVAGGYVYYSMEEKHFEVIDDWSGDVMATNFGTYEEAEAKAQELRQSTESIGWDKVQKLRQGRHC